MDVGGDFGSIVTIGLEVWEVWEVLEAPDIRLIRDDKFSKTLRLQSAIAKLIFLRLKESRSNYPVCPGQLAV